MLPLSSDRSRLCSARWESITSHIIFLPSWLLYKRIWQGFYWVSITTSSFSRFGFFINGSSKVSIGFLSGYYKGSIWLGTMFGLERGTLSSNTSHLITGRIGLTWSSI